MSMKQNLQDGYLFNMTFATAFSLVWNSRDATAEMAIQANGAPFNNLDPAGASRTVLLPPEADFKGKLMWFRNAADAGGEQLIIEEDSSTTEIVRLERGEVAVLFCDGTSWFVFSRSGGANALSQVGSGIWAKVPLVATTGTSGGGILSWANPTGQSIIVTRFMIDITTGSTGAATGAFGIAANGTTSNNTLLDGFNMQTTGVADNIENQGTNGVAAKKMTSSQFITGTASATVAGLVGSAYIQYILA